MIVTLVATLVTVYLTGYSYWDNTPPQSTAIAYPVIHSQAGGVGTYHDPITLAVSKNHEFKVGVLLYLPKLRKYAIVEDLCSACYVGYKGHPWVDVYVGGAENTAENSTKCARRITGLQTIITNPKPNYPVDVGVLNASGCRVYK